MLFAAVVVALSLGTPSAGAAADHISIATHGTTATWSFQLTTRETVPADVAVPLHVPAGARVIALRAGSLVAKAVPADAAHDWYRSVVAGGRDAALVELRDELVLHVSPVVRRAPVAVVLEIELARPRSWVDDDPTRVAVDADLALVAVKPLPVVAPIVVAAPTTAVACTFGGDRPIRRYIRAQHARLRHCYLRQAQGDPSLAGTVELAFTVTPDGHLRNVALSGTLDSPAVQACIADELATWELPPADSTTVVHYPLTFQLGR